MTTITTAAIDIDLRRVSMVSDDGLVMVGETSVKPVISTLVTHRANTGKALRVLVEVASSLSYGRPWPRSRVAWALWNIHSATIIDEARLVTDVLVSPSNVWTKGYPEAMRHELAKVKTLGKNNWDNHDLNECQAMLWSYREQPSLWIPFRDYMKELR